VLDESDIASGPMQQMRARAKGVGLLGDDADAKRALFDALPSVIAKRIQAITPQGVSSLRNYSQKWF
jgi:hypothetical protein